MMTYFILHEFRDLRSACRSVWSEYRKIDWWESEHGSQARDLDGAGDIGTLPWKEALESKRGVRDREKKVKAGFLVELHV